LILLEHLPVITIGRKGGEGHLRVSEEDLKARGIALERVDRGGDITYHGPGQLVGYPILDLREWERDIHLYLYWLEEVLIGVCQEKGIRAGRLEGLTGVWAGDRKVAAIGVRVSKWVSSHGFALNVSCDLTPFSYIVPCGIREKRVTSLQELLRAEGKDITLEEVIPVILQHFGRVFEAQIEESIRTNLYTRFWEPPINTDPHRSGF